MDSEFGKAIYSIASNPSYTTFCEVGAWNGKGSTLCLYEGIRNRREARLYSIEGDPQMYKLAVNVWKNNPKVALLYGTVHRSILSRQQVENHPLFYKVDEHYRLWYDTEVRTVQTAPLLHIPNCDVILFDGGEFSTQGDWDTLSHPELRVVMLDDTQVMKTNAIYNQLKQDPHWKCVYDVPTDRNGWAIFTKDHLV